LLLKLYLTLITYIRLLQIVSSDGLKCLKKPVDAFNSLQICKSDSIYGMTSI